MTYLNTGKLIMLAVAVSVFSLSANAQPRTVRAAIPAQNLTAIAFYIAQEKGYYRAEGLDVQLISHECPRFSRCTDRWGLGIQYCGGRRHDGSS